MGKWVGNIAYTVLASSAVTFNVLMRRIRYLWRFGELYSICVPITAEIFIPIRHNDDAFARCFI